MSDTTGGRDRGHADRAALARAFRETVLQPLRDRARENVEQEVKQLLSAGLSCAQALDYWMVAVQGYSRVEWADRRGVEHQTVAQRVDHADDTLGEIGLLEGHDDGTRTSDDPLAVLGDELYEAVGNELRRQARESIVDELLTLIDAGMTQAQAIDYYVAAGDGEPTYQEWADVRGVGIPAVKYNIQQGRKALDWSE